MENLQAVNTMSVERSQSEVNPDSSSDSVSSYTYNGTYVRRAISSSPILQEDEDLEPKTRAHQACFRGFCPFQTIEGFQRPNSRSSVQLMVMLVPISSRTRILTTLLIAC